MDGMGPCVCPAETYTGCRLSQRLMVVTIEEILVQEKVIRFGFQKDCSDSGEIHKEQVILAPFFFFNLMKQDKIVCGSFNTRYKNKETWNTIQQEKEMDY